MTSICMYTDDSVTASHLIVVVCVLSVRARTMHMTVDSDVILFCVLLILNLSRVVSSCCAFRAVYNFDRMQLSVVHLGITKLRPTLYVYKFS